MQRMSIIELFLLFVTSKIGNIKSTKKRLVDFNENNRYNGKDLPQICER